MGEATAIEWTDHTFNPWWGCVKVSPGCNNCYAEGFSKRVGKDIWGAKAERRFFGDKHWEGPVKWNRMAEQEGRRHRVFCASMGDVFEDRRDLDPWRERLWRLIVDTPHLDWQLLTKRPEVARRLLPGDYLPDNIWLGTSVEDQQRADERIPMLLSIPASVHFLSCEPLLGPVNLRKRQWVWGGARGRINWVIVGGESGPKHRPMKPEWVRDIRDACADSGTAFFFKQWGGRVPKAGGKEIDGREWCEMPLSGVAA
jgi:protein gp37